MVTDGHIAPAHITLPHPLLLLPHGNGRTYYTGPYYIATPPAAPPPGNGRTYYTGPYYTKTYTPCCSSLMLMDRKITLAHKTEGRGTREGASSLVHNKVIKKCFLCSKPFALSAVLRIVYLERGLGGFIVSLV